MEETVTLADWKQENKQLVSSNTKYALLFFSYLFWVVGALFAAIGGWSISQKVRYEEISEFATAPGAVLTCVGCLIFIISTFGVLGVLRENIRYLKTYKVLLVAILVFEFCAGLIGFAFWPEIKKIVDSKISLGIEQYTDNANLRFMIDQVQRQFECCGSLHIDDWDSSPYYRCKILGSYRSCGVPWSCCHRRFERNRQCGLKIRKKRSKIDMSKTIYTIGCLDKLFEYMRIHMFLIGSLAVACNIPLLFGVYLSQKMIKQIKKIALAFNEANEKFHWVENARTATSPPFSVDMENTNLIDENTEDDVIAS